MNTRVAVAMLLGCLFLANASYAVTLHVPGDYQTIQAAINAASTGDCVQVSKGTYYENITFAGKAITVRSTYQTDDTAIEGTIIDGSTGQWPEKSTVRFTSGESSTSILRGFTLTGGLGHLVIAGGTYGGGVYCTGTSPQITNCVIRDNGAAWGGGVYCDGGTPRFVNVTIKGNSASECGGGMYLDSCDSSLTSMSVDGNSADSGAGLYVAYSDLTMVTSDVHHNAANQAGGGVYIVSCVPVLTNNRVYYNSASQGGGIYCSTASPSLINNTVDHNGATYGGAIYCKSWSEPVIKNNIVSFTSSGGALYVDTTEDPDYPSAPDVTYCDFYSSVGGNYVNWPSQTGLNGNIAQQPWFQDYTAADYHEKSPYGRWDPVSLVWRYDVNCSPCIDAGDPASAYSEEPSPNGGRINMGAYGNTAFASKHD